LLYLKKKKKGSHGCVGERGEGDGEKREIAIERDTDCGFTLAGK
jgi:hypothetical protein